MPAKISQNICWRLVPFYYYPFNFRCQTYNSPNRT